MKVCFVVASPMTAIAFLMPHLRELESRHVVRLAVNTDDPELLQRRGLNIPVDGIPIERPIRIAQDLRALLELYRLFRLRRFDVVHSVTPKAGLLTALAGWSARVPIRVHIFTGQVWATRTGPSRWLLKSMDRLIVRLVTHVLVDSGSQRDFLVDEGVVDERRIRVLAHGSISGVDTKRFRPNIEARRRIREELRIPIDGLMVLFLGRMNRDKGIADLAEAFARLAARVPKTWLVLVGGDEDGMTEVVRGACSAVLDQVRFVDFTDVPERYVAAADVFCLPSYREGFGSSVIEAAACGVPAVASRIYGVTDAVEDNVTGLLHPPGDVDAIVAGLEALLTDTALREQMGRAALERTTRLFEQSVVTGALLDFYDQVGRERA